MQIRRFKVLQMRYIRWFHILVGSMPWQMNNTFIIMFFCSWLAYFFRVFRPVFKVQTRCKFMCAAPSTPVFTRFLATCWWNAPAAKENSCNSHKPSVLEVLRTFQKSIMWHKIPIFRRKFTPKRCKKGVNSSGLTPWVLIPHSAFSAPILHLQNSHVCTHSWWSRSPNVPSDTVGF